MSDPVEGAAGWAEQHKAVAASAVGATLLLILFLRHRSKVAASTTGATVPDTTGMSLVPYGDATTSGIAGLTDAITGLTTTLTPPNDAGSATGGTNTGTVTPTGGGAGSGGTTGATAWPKIPRPIPKVAAKPVTRTAPKPVAKPVVHKSYTVKPGDNLTKIAAASHLSLARLEALNPQTKKNPNLIHPGDRLLIS